MSKALPAPLSVGMWFFISGGHGREVADEAHIYVVGTTAAPLTGADQLRRLSQLGTVRDQMSLLLALKALAAMPVLFPMDSWHLAQPSCARDKQHCVSLKARVRGFGCELHISVGDEGDGLHVLKLLLYATKVHLELESLGDEQIFEVSYFFCMGDDGVSLDEGVPEARDLSEQVGLAKFNKYLIYDNSAGVVWVEHVNHTISEV
ncbi:hypothetical protein EDB85DRAFT_1901075 [Lactarius pseudohatsudake]|nr:hypothetical protein EDB85DRAFT_1901075 [Lactarius pseudohatsudake]